MVPKHYVSFSIFYVMNKICFKKLYVMITLWLRVIYVFFGQRFYFVRSTVCNELYCDKFNALHRYKKAINFSSHRDIIKSIHPISNFNYVLVLADTCRTYCFCCIPTIIIFKQKSNLKVSYRCTG